MGFQYRLNQAVNAKGPCLSVAIQERIGQDILKGCLKAQGVRKGCLKGFWQKRCAHAQKDLGDLIWSEKATQRQHLCCRWILPLQILKGQREGLFNGTRISHRYGMLLQHLEGVAL